MPTIEPEELIDRRKQSAILTWILGLTMVMLTAIIGCTGEDSGTGPEDEIADVNHAPKAPFNPTPSDGMEKISAPVTLTWSCADQDGDSLLYSVRLGTTASPPLVRIQLRDTSYTPRQLLPNETYWWQIEATDPDSATTPGPIWRFTTADCDSVVGNLELPPEIEILAAESNFISGFADNVSLSKHRIVLWAKTDRWHVQPSAENPFTTIQCDGSWENTTNTWERILALIVDSEYQPSVTNDIHPSEEFGVLAWDEYPAPSARSVTFSEWEWYVKSAEAFEAGPGPNYFSGTEAAVWVDGEGLHLATEERDGKWFSAEVILAEATGYGTYTYELGSRVDNLDFRLVFAGFLYETTNQEIDFEFSRSLVGEGHNAQYVVQPWDAPGNILRYTMPPVVESTHRLEWQADHITWTSWSGGIEDEHPDNLIYTWTYTGPWNPAPDKERFRFNLWLHGGDAPLSNQRDEVLIRSFSYQP